MAGMARRTTVVFSNEDVAVVARTNCGEDVLRSEPPREAYRPRTRPLTGWLRLSSEELSEIEQDVYGCGSNWRPSQAPCSDNGRKRIKVDS